MKTIVFLGSHKSGSSYEAIRTSDRMGYYTVLLTDRPSFIDKRLDFTHAHSVRLCNLDDAEEIKNAVERLKMERFDIHAIVSFIDPHCLTAAILSRYYGFTVFSEKAVRSMLDKIESREILKNTPFSPYYSIIGDKRSALQITRQLPLVIKSPYSSGSKDVYLAQTENEYADIYYKLKQQYPGIPILAEKYIEGPQFLVETLTVGGKTHIAAVIGQEITFTGRFIVTGYRMVTRDGDYRSLKAAAEEIIRLFGMKDGPCHLEFRYWGGGWVLIEANPRISGGAMNAFIETATGVNLAGETLKAALGKQPHVDAKYQKEAYLQYILVPGGGVLDRVTGKSMAQNSPGVERVYVKPKKGAVLQPPLSMGSRYAYVIATGTTAEQAESNAKNAAGKIVFHLREDLF
jgi:biotin carboxylase